MFALRTSAMRTALRPVRLQAGNIRPQRLAATQTRSATTGPGEPPTTSPTNPRKQPPGVGDKGIHKEFNKDGNSPSKNAMYAGLAALTVVAIGYVSMTPKKIENSAPAARS